MTIAGRLHYLDNLRALAMLAGVLFHAALAYSPLAQPMFPTADRDNSIVVDLFAWLPHLFRMPLFFVVAGFFAARMVQQRGFGGMFRNRLLRIALPFVLGWPLLHLTLKALTLHAARTAVHPSPLLAFIRELMQSGDGLPQMLPGTGHLWFLYYLMLFYVLAWIARSLELGWLGARIRTLSATWIIGALPLLLVPALASVAAPHPAPESIFPQFWALGFFAPFFAFGYLLHATPALLDRLQRPAPWLFVGSLLLYAGWWLAIDRGADAGAAPDDAAWHVAVLEAYISVWMTAVSLIVGRHLLDRQIRVLQPFADAAYWTYLMHLPILFAIQYRLMDVALPWGAKFAIAVLSTLALCLVSHRLIVQPTAMSRVFGGRAPQPQSAVA